MWRKAPFTILIISINFIVYTWMLFAGVNFLNPNINDLIDFGANFNALVSNGEYWRLVSSIFLHGGLVHLLANMIALSTLGTFAEKKLGGLNYSVIYLLSGLAAGLATDYWHSFNVSVGASGAIMGIAGANLAIILIKSYNNSDDDSYEGALKNLLISIIATLILGIVVDFIDNVAHVGGLIFGFAITLICYSTYNTNLKKATFILSLVCSLIIIIAAAIYIPDSSYRYYKAFNLFLNYEKKANDNFSNTTYIETNTFSNNIRKAETDWLQCTAMLSTTKDLTPPLTNDINALKRYASYKSRYYHILYRAINEEEYQLFDTLELISSRMSMLPQAQNGILPKQNQKENTETNEWLKTVTIYYDSLWEQTTVEKSSYFRIATVDSLGRINGRVTDYFKSGNKQMKGTYFNDLQNDVFRYYFENGNYDAIGKFNMEERIGKWKMFYEDGQIKEIRVYGDTSVFMKDFWDEFGQQLVMDGNGIFMNYYTISKFLTDSGSYLEGYKDGIWKGYYDDGKPYYKDLYRNGALIKGISLSKSGSRFYYTNDYVAPQPVGMTESYNEYLQNNLTYPTEALKNKIEGVVIIDINVDSLGTKTKIKPVNKLPYGCTEEALRLVTNGPVFTTAFLKGQPVASVKRVYITFKINR